MKKLERAIDTMQDDLMDSYILFDKAKQAKHEGIKEEADMYITRVKNRFEMFEKDIVNIETIIKEWEHEEMKEMTEKEKEVIQRVKKIYMKFYEYELRKGEELKKHIIEFKTY